MVVDDLVSRARELFAHSPTDTTGFTLKPDGSRVTELDHAIEKAWRAVIRRSCPEHSVIGEEFGPDDPGRRYCWYLDPVDGTDDFSRGMPLFGYIIALTLDGRPVVAATGHPALGIESRATFGRGTCVDGQRSADLAGATPGDPAIVVPAMDDFLRHDDESNVLVDLAKRIPNYRVYRNLYGHTAVVTGALDAGLEFDVAPWDILATRLLVEETGGSFVKFRAITLADGQQKSGAVFGRMSVVEDICRVLAARGYRCRSADDFDTTGV